MNSTIICNFSKTGGNIHKKHFGFPIKELGNDSKRLNIRVIPEGFYRGSSSCFTTTFGEVTFISGKHRITLNKTGSSFFNKMSFPLHCGVFTEIETDDFIFHFNLKAEIIRARGKGRQWTHPHEWLKRSCGNDWVYYSTGGYTGVFEATGEYYLPNLQYATNNLLGGHPFAQEQVREIVDGWHPILEEISTHFAGKPDHFGRFFQKALKNSPEILSTKADELFSIIDGRISVLPPDARHVDYNLIPLTISKGCLYKCRFCKVKNKIPFTEKSVAEVNWQINRLKQFYNDDCRNYNAIYLGEHDALQANPNLILHSIEESYQAFTFDESFLDGSHIFLFGSVSSLLNCSAQFFKNLHKLPGHKYINIGLESADQETLDLLGKPLLASQVKEAFRLIQEINDRYSSIEITVNFILDDELPANHYPSMLELIRHQQTRVKPKGTVYLSPLKFDLPSRKRLFEFNRIKIASRLPTYLYIIQRL